MRSDLDISSNLLIEDTGLFSLETDTPICSALASKALQSIQNKNLRYRASDGYIFTDWEKPDIQIDNLDHREFYVNAYAELPNLVLRHLRRSGITSKIDSPGKPQEELICRQQLLAYKIKAQWLKVYLLEDESLLSGLRKSHEKHLRCESSTSKSVYYLIQEMRIVAALTQNERYQWLLSFDSPAQVWFSYEAFVCLVHMTRKLTPGNKQASVSKKQYREEVCKLADSFFNTNIEKQRRLFLNSKKNRNPSKSDDSLEIGYIYEDQAIELTAKEMIFAEEDSQINAFYRKYMETWKAEANYRRKHKELTTSYIDANGNVQQRST